MLFDAHTHLNFEKYNEKKREELAGEILASQVEYIMDAGDTLESSLQVVKNCEKYDFCYGAVGIHPHNAKDMDNETLLFIENLAKKDKIKAIGEIGLDYYYDNSERDEQRYWFREQIRLANKLKMPIMIHSRSADKDTLDILMEEGAFSQERKSWFPKRTGIYPDDARVQIHCYSGSKETAIKYISLGATISIAGPITYANNRKTVEVVQNVPMEYLLSETDAPYLAPVPFRGKENKSIYVEHVVRRIALLKQITYEEAADITFNNAKRFFNID